MGRLWRRVMRRDAAGRWRARRRVDWRGVAVFFGVGCALGAIATGVGMMMGWW